MTRKLILCLPLAFALASCGGTTPGAPVTLAPSAAVTPQTVAQQVEAKWPVLKAGVALALYNDGATPAKVAVATTAETTLYAQVTSCAQGTDPTCLSSLKPAVQAFLTGLQLGPKGQLELAVAEAVLPPGWAPGSA